MSSRQATTRKCCAVRSAGSGNDIPAATPDRRYSITASLRRSPGTTAGIPRWIGRDLLRRDATGGVGRGHHFGRSEEGVTRQVDGLKFGFRGARAVVLTSGSEVPRRRAPAGHRSHESVGAAFIVGEGHRRQNTTV